MYDIIMVLFARLYQFYILLKLPIIICFFAMLQKSPYYDSNLLRVVPLYPKHASTLLQLNVQLENINWSVSLMW